MLLVACGVTPFRPTLGPRSLTQSVSLNIRQTGIFWFALTNAHTMFNAQQNPC